MTRAWRAGVVSLILSTSGAAFSLAAVPVLVSPGAAERALASPSACPTFSWGAGPVGLPIELVVVRVEGEGVLGSSPVLRQVLPAGASAWTPSSDRCLPVGRYAWSLRIQSADEAEWSEARLFSVQPDARDAEIHRLTRIVQDLQARTTAPEAVAATETQPSAPGRRANLRSESVGTDEAFTPVGCTGVFDDVSSGDYCPWIEAAYADDLVEACAGDSAYCPTNAVTRQQLAVHLEKVRHGTAGGALTGNYPDPDLTAAFKLPDDCEAGEFAGWAGSEWICAECLTSSNCGSPSECTTPTCSNLVCAPIHQPEGTPSGQQTSGDCQLLVCDGDGGYEQQSDDLDVPSDDGNQCTDQACNAGTPSYPPSPAGTPAGGPCDGPADTDFCAEGMTVCNGSSGTMCNDPAENDVEACNSFDDDCDGQQDEDFPTLGNACTTSFPGVCAAGVVTCAENGNGVQCTGLPPGSQPEICANGLDDDCDNMTDEAGCTPP